MRRGGLLLIGLLLFTIGAWTGARIDDFLDRDSCLDHGGRWSGGYCEGAARTR